MPIFNSYKAIFIHIPKCAGTSITSCLDRENVISRFTTYDNFSIKLMYGRNLQHSTYNKIRMLHPLKFTSYYKFSFVRNPFDRMYSEYSWRKKWDKKLENKTFEEMLMQVPLYRKIGEPHFIEQSNFIYTQRNKLMVDYLGRFETLEYDFKNIVKTLGIEQLDLKILNRSRESKNYSNKYSDEAKELVNRFFARDIELLEYEF